MLQLGAHRSAHHANFGGHPQLAAEFFADAVHIEINAAGWLGDKINGAQFQRLQGNVGAFARLRADDDNRPRIGRHDEFGRLQTVHVRHVDIHGDNVGLE